MLKYVYPRTVENPSLWHIREATNGWRQELALNQEVVKFPAWCEDGPFYSTDLTRQFWIRDQNDAGPALAVTFQGWYADELYARDLDEAYEDDEDEDPPYDDPEPGYDPSSERPSCGTLPGTSWPFPEQLASF